MLSQLKHRSLQIFQTFGYRVLSPTCIICRLASGRLLDLCQTCEDELPLLSSVCSQCALPLEQTANHEVCGHCLQTPPPFNRTIALYHYQAPVDRLINDLKFHHRLANSAVLGRLLTQKIRSIYDENNLPELLIPIPLHKKRLRERGFNQALEIAKPIARQLNIPIDKFNCQRVRNTAPQTQLSAKERRKNLRAAFVVKNITAKHVAVIDDVMTTASTMNEFCHCLRRAGVEQIDVWCVARTNLR